MNSLEPTNNRSLAPEKHASRELDTIVEASGSHDPALAPATLTFIKFVVPASLLNLLRRLRDLLLSDSGAEVASANRAGRSYSVN